MDVVLVSGSLPPEFALETTLAATALPTRFHQEPENFPLEVEKFADAKGKASNLWQAVEASDIPAYYLWQIQNQLVVSGTTQACLDVSDGKEGIFLEVSKFVDTEARIDAAWEAF